MYPELLVHRPLTCKWPYFAGKLRFGVFGDVTVELQWRNLGILWIFHSDLCSKVVDKDIERFMTLTSLIESTIAMDFAIVIGLIRGLV